MVLFTLRDCGCGSDCGCKRNPGTDDKELGKETGDTRTRRNRKRRCAKHYTKWVVGRRISDTLLHTWNGNAWRIGRNDNLILGKPPLESDDSDGDCRIVNTTPSEYNSTHTNKIE